jgi:ornithine carbamoyltransferase
MVDVVMIRTFRPRFVERFATPAKVPVINALTDDFHPCQLLADMQTWFASIAVRYRGHRVCWLGDGNNMCHSYINAARLLDFELRRGLPEGFEPSETSCETTPTESAWCAIPRRRWRVQICW